MWYNGIKQVVIIGRLRIISCTKRREMIIMANALLLDDKLENTRDKKFYDVISCIKDSYLKIYGKDIVDIYLYGSYACGDYDVESDMDFVAIVEGERKDLQSKLKKVWDIISEFSLEYDIIISPSVIPYSEFNKYKKILPYYQNIVKEGLKVGWFSQIPVG